MATNDFGSGGIGSESPEAQGCHVQSPGEAAAIAATNCGNGQQHMSPTDSSQQYIHVELKPLRTHPNPVETRPDGTTQRPQWQHLLQPGKVIQPMDSAPDNQRTSHPQKRGNSIGTVSRLVPKSSRPGKRRKSSQALAASWNAVISGTALHCNHATGDGAVLGADISLTSTEKRAGSSLLGQLFGKSTVVSSSSADLIAARRSTFAPAARANRGGKINHGSFTPAFHSSSIAGEAAAPYHGGLHQDARVEQALGKQGKGVMLEESVSYRNLQPDWSPAAAAGFDGIAVDMDEENSDHISKPQPVLVARPIHTLAQLLAGDLTVF